MELIQDFIDEELLGGKIIFDQSRGGYQYEETEEGITIHARSMGSYERFFFQNPEAPVEGTCRIIAGAVIGKLRSRGWNGKVRYGFSYGHVVPVLSSSSSQFLIDLGRRMPIPIPVPVNTRSVVSNVYSIPHTYQASGDDLGFKLEINGVGSRQEKFTFVSDEEEEKVRILESTRHNSLLLRSHWVGGAFVQSCTNETPAGQERLQIREKLLRGIPVKVVLHG